MSALALKGHETRGSEIIELLKMLGGCNNKCCFGNSTGSIYYISDNGCIEFDSLDEKHTVFTLEQFEEKFPYKVGDKVMYKRGLHFVKGMEWNGEEIRYKIEYGFGFSLTSIKVEELEPYKAKEETMEEKENLILDCVSTDKGHEIVPLEGYEIKLEGDKFYLVKKKPQYPKTYKECCEVLGMQSNLFLSLSSVDLDGEVEEKSYGYKIAFQMNCFYELLVCRDAYWKMAGDWEPSDCQIVYGISRSCDKIEKVDDLFGGEMVLEFPSREMRDSFYKNFYDLINKCKELI